MKKFRIERISCKNFLGLKSCCFPPSKKVVVMSAPFGKGKTSMLKMFSFALTGKVPGMVYMTNKEPQDGFVECVVATEETRVVIKRTLHANGGQTLFLDGKKTTQKSGNQYICNILGCTQESLEAQTDIHSIPNLTNKELTNLFVKNLPIKFKNSDSYIEVANEFVKTDEEVNALLKSIMPNEEFGIPETQEMYKKLYEKRREMNKELKRFSSTASSIENSIDSTVEPDKLSEYKEELEKIIVQIERARNYEKEKDKYVRDLKAYEQQKAQIKENNDFKKTQEHNLKLLKSNYIPVSEEAFKQNKMLLESNKKQLQLIEKSLTETALNLRNRKEDLKNFENPHACPFNKFLKEDKIICKTDKTIAKNSIIIEIQNGEKHYQELEKGKKETASVIENAENDLKEFEERRRVGLEIKELEERLQNMPVITLGKKPEFKEVEFSEKELINKKAEIESKLTSISKVNELKKIETSLKELNKNIGTINRTLELLAPSGVNSFVLNKAIDLFETNINKEIKYINPNFSIKFNVNNGFEMLYKSKPDMEYISLENASSGEKTLVSYALGTLLIGINDTGLLLIDNVDNLDIESQEKFIELISQKNELSLAVIVTNDRLELNSKNVQIIGNK